MKKPIYKKWWFWVLAVIVIAIIANLSGYQTKETSAPAVSEQPKGSEPPKATDPPKPSPSPKNKETISKAEFEKIESGMTYEQVTEIIGGPGDVMSESGKKGEAMHTVMYTYKGEGDIGANANMMFQGNKLQNKAQMGLK